MQNTIENKSKFFAQYFNQHILKNSLNKDVDVTFNVRHLDAFTDDNMNNCYLLLTPLSAITDEDAIEVSRILDSNFRQPLEDKYKDFHASRGKSHVVPERPCRSDVSDYLRSKSYALPWMGLSVETLVEYGWIKLKQL